MIKLYIGLDVHKASTSIGLAAADGSEPAYYGKCSSTLRSTEETLKRILKRHGVEQAEVRLCYEAGPCGFVLVRRLLRLGYDICVIAPSLTPKAPGERVKTDRRDALKLARLLRAGELVVVHVPEANDEAIRDVGRARTDAVDDLRRARFRLGAFLLRNGHGWTGKARWGATHMSYLRGLCLETPAHKLVLEEYLLAIDDAEARVTRFEQHLESLLALWDRAPWARSVQGFRGFRLVGSMIVSSELGDLTRFDHPRQLMGFVGLVPGEDSSGTRRRQGSITKCGNSHARWMLIEAAGSYRLPPRVSPELSKRQAGLSKAVREVSWRAQNRLHKRYHRLKRRGLHENKIKVAIARELLGFLWELAHIVRAEESGCDQRAPSAEFSQASVAPSVGSKKAGALRPRPRPMVATPEYPSESCSPAELSSVCSDALSNHQEETQNKDKKQYNA